ncbi:MAG: PhoP regulatory network YrbL family protein [Desulfofustis sp.]|nr:PhoP regulatory network YrbL family protein [Desulfofustis sp.]
MITLDDNSMIGRGTLRACYLHPQDETLIIKVGRADRVGGNDANRKEFLSFQKINKRHDKLDHISRCHGFVETDRGEGLVCDCIRDSSGEISQTIWNIVVHEDACDIENILEVARTLCDYLIDKDLFLFDINLKNIVLRKGRDNNYRAYAIDLKGPYDNKEFLQLSSRITFLGRKKLKRRSKQLLERIVEFREQREQLKKLAR